MVFTLGAFGTPSFFGNARWPWYNFLSFRHRALRSGRCRNNLPLGDLREAMRTPHELVELSVFLILLGLALPMLKSLHDVYPVVAIVASIMLFLPAPAWLARLRVGIPDRLETAIVWHSVVAWVIVLGVFCVGVVLALYKWCVAT